MALGIFRQGLNLPRRVLKYGVQGAINAKNLRKIAFHLPTGGNDKHASDFASCRIAFFRHLENLNLKIFLHASLGGPLSTESRKVTAPQL